MLREHAPKELLVEAEGDAQTIALMPVGLLVNVLAFFYGEGQVSFIGAESQLDHRVVAKGDVDAAGVRNNVAEPEHLLQITSEHAGTFACVILARPASCTALTVSTFHIAAAVTELACIGRAAQRYTIAMKDLGVGPGRVDEHVTLERLLCLDERGELGLRPEKPTQGVVEGEVVAARDV